MTRGSRTAGFATSGAFSLPPRRHLEAHGTPASLDALSAHRAILYANRETDWRFETPSGAVAVRPRPGLRVNNGVMMRGAAVAGLGLALLAHLPLS